MIHYNLSANVVALSTKRHLRTSSPYSSFNLNPYCGDTAEHVAESRRIFCEAVGINPDRLIMPRQVHGREVFTVDSAFLALSEAERTQRLDGIDALVTDLPDTFICVSTADCIPVLVCDEAHHALAAIHAGWRGTVQNIVGETLRHMTNVYGTRPTDCKAIIGPGISLDSFEVGDEVYETFRIEGFDMNTIAILYPSSHKWHIDLWEANRQQLTELGVLPANIHIAGICTYKNVDTFFSARRLSINSGRITTGLMWTTSV